MNEIGETYKAMNAFKKKKRQKNKELSTALLVKNKIPFESKDGGSHLVTPHFDFYPATGFFINRKNGLKGRGVFNLIELENDLLKTKNDLLKTKYKEAVCRNKNNKKETQQ